jgi:hypothetical protein
MAVIDDIYNAFNPMPLQAGAPQYVDFTAVRGGSDVSIELGRKVQRSNLPTCQLFSGHLGGGKSTELLRLKAELETKGFTVVYFAADDDDINAEDVEYTDILLACTRHLLEVVREADPKPVIGWLRDRWDGVVDIMQTEIHFPETSIEAQINQFAKITAKIRTQKSQRAQLRAQLSPYTDNLIDALNEFIEDAKKRLPPERNKLMVIADGLEKIQYILLPDGRSNHDDIFIARANQLKSLACHVIYTVPISMALSTRASDLMDIYGGSPEVLPMVEIRSRGEQISLPGMEKLREMLDSRVRLVTQAKLIGEVFDSEETLAFLCRMSGGHVRNLVILMQYAIDYQDRLPITMRSMELSAKKMRRTYRESVYAGKNEWELLAQVAVAKLAPNDDRFRSLLFRRCILQYLDEEGETWHDVHPLLIDVEEFQAPLRGMTT